MSEDIAYKDLIGHLRNWIIRLPESKNLLPLLKLRIKPEEAKLLSKIPFIGFTAEQLSAKIGIPINKLTKQLEKFSKKGIVFRSKRGSEIRYSLRDSLFIFYRSLGWRGKNDKINRKISPLLNQYYIETYAEEFIGHETQGLRAIPINETIQDTRQVMPYEDIIKVIDNFNYYSVSSCPCSHRHNLDNDFEDCKHDLERCLHFDGLGRYCVENGLGKEITKEETLRILRMSADAGLVHGVSNTQEKMDTICNCCSCCCLFLESVVNMSGFIPRGHQPSNYIREVDDKNCIVCGLCARLCPMKALKVNDKKLLFEPERCIGCGVCAHKCKHDAAYLIHRQGEQDFPKDPREQGMRFLKERGIDPMKAFIRNMLK
ncbi:MAG: 4Fe-4S binding protein [Promethearchaeota archaeon]|jgi:ferredoxin